MQQVLAWLWVLLGAIWTLFGWISGFQSIHEYYTKRKTISRRIARVLTSRAFGLIVFVTGIGFLYCIHYGIPAVIWDRALRVSILQYRYDYASGDVVADVQFENNGSDRRIVTGAVLTFHAPYMVEEERVLLTTKPEDLYGVGGPPLYIEPRLPVMATYRTKLTDPTMIQQPGNCLGLQINTIDRNGRVNYTNLDVLEVKRPIKNGMLPLLLIRRLERVSLDKPWSRINSRQ